MSQFQLIKSRRFLPLFCTQFLGAFNDNVYKNALIILITFQATSLYGLDSNMLVVISGGIFILPFFLVSATAGQLADKYEKSVLIQRIKILEIVIMVLAVIGFYFNSIFMLMLLLFLMGAQSTLFGPLKYGILPQHLQVEELVGGNGLISMGTFLAILLGTILGGLLISIPEYGGYIVAIMVVFFAGLGFIASLFIPKAEAAEPEIQLNWNIFSQTVKTMGYALENKMVFVSILAISWFWFVGSTYLYQVPAYSKTILGSNNEVVTLLLTTFSIGIGLGAMMCEKLSGGKIELGIVTLGAIGISWFSTELYFASQPFMDLAPPEGQMNASEFLTTTGSWRVLIDLILIGFFGGIYIVPLNATVQKRSHPQRRARVIAALSILSGLFMVASTLTTLAMLKMGLTTPQIFLVLAVLNIIITGVFFLLQPEFLKSFVRWLRFTNNE
jgi:MFS family permease